jgi:ELWxxDGT repeat protein
LWQSDGTSAGTTLVKDIVTEEARFVSEFLTNVNGTLFFTAKTLRTVLSCGKVTARPPGPHSSKISTAEAAVRSGSLTNVNGTLFFQANDGTNGYELWQSDGTSAGTTLVKDIRSGSAVRIRVL